MKHSTPFAGEQDPSECESCPKLELARRVGVCRDLAETVIDPPGAIGGHTRRRKLWLVGDVIGRDIEAEIPLFAQLEISGECEIQIIGSHGADTIKICWRSSRNKRVSVKRIAASFGSRHREAARSEPHRRRMWRALARIADDIGPLIEVDPLRIRVWRLPHQR